MKKKLKKFKFYKPLIMALVLVFAFPIFAFASTTYGNTSTITNGKPYVIVSSGSGTYLIVFPDTVPNKLYLNTYSSSGTTMYGLYTDTTVHKQRYTLISGTNNFDSVNYVDNNTNALTYLVNSSSQFTVQDGTLDVYDSTKTNKVFTAVVPDTTAPKEITNLVESHNDTSIYFSWTNPTDTDFDHVNIYKSGTKIGTSTDGTFADSSLIASTSYSYSFKTVDKTGNESSGTSKSVTTDVTPNTGTTPSTGSGDTNTNPITGGISNMFTNLTSTAILTEATTWANNFNAMLLVVVGVGVGFACVRFVKGLFF